MEPPRERSSSDDVTPSADEAPSTEASTDVPAPADPEVDATAVAEVDDDRPTGTAEPLPPPSPDETAAAPPPPPPPPPVVAVPMPSEAPNPLPDLTPATQTAASIPPPPPPGTTTLVADAPPPPPPSPATGRSKGPLVLLAIAAVALVAGAIAFAVSGDDDGDAATDPVAQDATTTTGDEDEEEQAERADDKTVEQTGAPDPSDPQAYGDDPDLDRLYDSCKGGDMAACDRLYRQSGFGTEYEAFGDTCGKRNRSQGYCTELYAAPGASVPSGKLSDGLADTSAVTYGDDPDLDRFWDKCEAGDVLACDSLYLSAPAGTDYELYGATCGGRNEVQGYCAELYG